MKSVFLDRDGVVTKKLGLHCCVTNESDLEINPGVVEMLKALQSAGFLLIIITNQSGVAKGLMTLEDLDKINHKLERELSLAGIMVKIYFCPHDDRDHCSCRKPKPGLILRAMKDYDLRPEDCWIVGDSEIDIEAGRAAGVINKVFIKNCDKTSLERARQTILGLI